jgi:mRNA interferase RelE/StbE
MQVIFLSRFSKDLDKVNQRSVKDALIRFIAEAERAASIRNFSNIKKLAGHRSAYRLRIGDYRVGLFVQGDTVEFARILHRKDIYNEFP